jgi:hypothetical protein
VTVRASGGAAAWRDAGASGVPQTALALVSLVLLVSEQAAVAQGAGGGGCGVGVVTVPPQIQKRSN